MDLIKKKTDASLVSFFQDKNLLDELSTEDPKFFKYISLVYNCTNTGSGL